MPGRRTEEEGEWCIEQTILKDGEPECQLILDDGDLLTGMKCPEMLETSTASPRPPPAKCVCWKWWKKAREFTINVNDSVTEQERRNLWCRHLNDGIKRGAGMLLSGKLALVMATAMWARAPRRGRTDCENCRDRSDLRHAGLRGRFEVVSPTSTATPARPAPSIATCSARWT